jgi:hypothetical protein
VRVDVFSFAELLAVVRADDDRAPREGPEVHTDNVLRGSGHSIAQTSATHSVTGGVREPAVALPRIDSPARWPG